MPTWPSARALRAGLRKHSTEVLLFFLVWFVFGAFIKSTDLEAYNLQQMGVDAIVDHGTFSLGHSSHPLLQPRGDVFEARGHLLAAKQPGQFVWGAIAYAPLYAVGLTYDRDYTLTSAWVTWLSSTSFAALSMVLVFVLGFRVWGLGYWPSLLAAIGSGFGTNLFAYSGVAHHDVIAGSLALGAFVAFEGARRLHHRSLWWWCGLSAGLSVFTSMLPSLVVLTILITAGVFALRSRGWILLGAGFAVGILPLAIHNWYYFGSPLTQANAAGNYADTFFRPSLEIFLPHLRRYFGTGELSIWTHAPLAGLGLLSLAWMITDRRFRVSAGVMLGATLLHAGYVLNIETFGHCQFGPRYFLPLMPMLTLPIAYLLEQARSDSRIERKMGRWLAVFVVGVGLVSIAISTTGARIGTMNCDLSHWLPGSYWRGEGIFANPRYPLWIPMGILCFITLLAASLIRIRESGRPREISRGLG